MSDKLKGYYFKTKSQICSMKDKIKDRRSVKEHERFMQRQMEKEKLKALAKEQKLQAKKNPPIKSKKITEDEIEFKIEAEIQAKLDKWGRSRNLPDWAIKQMKEKIIAEQRASIYRNELEEAKEELLDKYESNHWVVSGKCPPKMREDDLICTPYPFAKTQISLSDLKKGAKVEKPVLILKTIKTERGETVLSKEKKISKSTPAPTPIVKQKAKDSEIAKTEKSTKGALKIDEKSTIGKLKIDENSTIGKLKIDEKSTIGTLKIEEKSTVSKKPASEITPKQDEPYFGIAPPAPDESSLSKGEGGDFEKNMENKGSMGQMIKFLFDDEKKEDKKSSTAATSQKSTSDNAKSMTSEEDESYCDNVTEMNTMVNRALTQLGPGDESPRAIRLKNAGIKDEGKPKKDKITSQERIRLKFKEEVVCREYWYAHGEESDKKKPLKPSKT